MFSNFLAIPFDLLKERTGLTGMRGIKMARTFFILLSPLLMTSKVTGSEECKAKTPSLFLKMGSYGSIHSVSLLEVRS